MKLYKSYVVEKKQTIKRALDKVALEALALLRFRVRWVQERLSADSNR